MRPAEASKKSNVPEGLPCANVRPWEVGVDRDSEWFYTPIRAALVARAELVPYLYTAARETFESGLGLLRPMCELPRQSSSHPTVARPRCMSVCH